MVKIQPKGYNLGRNRKVSLESISLPGEVWKSIVVDGKVHPWYSVSTMGRCASHFGQEKLFPSDPKSKSMDRSHNLNWCRILKPSYSYKNNHDPNKRDAYGNEVKVKQKIIFCTRISVRFPWDFFHDINMHGSEHQYPKQGLQSSYNGEKCQRTIAVHKLVAATHMSVDEYPPERIAKSYPSLPDEVKQWIRETVTVNHIDHDPTNNCIENLEYVTQRENTLKALQYYGGHFNISTEKYYAETCKTEETVLN